MKLAFSSTPINYATYGALAHPTLIIVFLDLLATLGMKFTSLVMIRVLC